MCYNSLRSLMDLVSLQVELSSLPELTELRKTQVKTQLSMEKATETITSKLVESMTGPEAEKAADIKSAAELISLAESLKIDSTEAKAKLGQIISSELNNILKKYS